MRPETADVAVMSRRVVIGGGVAASSLGHALAAPADAKARIEAVERRLGGRIGLAAMDARGRMRVSHRAQERFAMCSTFKLLLVAAVLARVDAGSERLGRLVHYGPADLLNYAPATSAKVSAGGMIVSDLCAAAIELSDNTAANLLLASIGGPAGYTAFVRTLGDKTTRLDRNEPALNSALPGDPRDTTSPAAAAEDLRRVLLGLVLTPDSRERLIGWLVGCKTGERRLRKRPGRARRHCRRRLHREPRPWLNSVCPFRTAARPTPRMCGAGWRAARSA